jgi:hypothetical protein
MSRRQSAAAARLWSLITLGAALAGVAAGRLDGSLLITVVAAIALPFGAGAVSVARGRRVSAEDAARQLDAAFGFDEQVATALCCAEAAVSASASRPAGPGCPPIAPRLACAMCAPIRRPR